MLERLGLFPPQASTMAARVDALYGFLIAVSTFFGLLIAGTLIVFAIRYRRSKDNEKAVQIEGSLALEALWSVIPFGISMVIFAWGASVYFAMAHPPANSMEIFVVGKQWMWKVQHLEGRREINRIHVPAGRPVKLTMTSEDVIHSFYIPAFRVKADALPNRYTTLWFEATKPGTYHLFCAEYCGTQHSRMIGEVVVLEPSQFQAWLTGEGGGGGEAGGEAVASAAELGQAVFVQQGCPTCHSVEVLAPAAGHEMVGPALSGLFGKEVELAEGGVVTADEAYIRQSILEPMAKIVRGYEPSMPTYRGRINQEQVLQLIAYLKTLKGPETQEPVGHGTGM